VSSRPDDPPVALDDRLDLLDQLGLPVGGQGSGGRQ
jgi:hypothetical protein